MGPIRFFWESQKDPQGSKKISGPPPGPAREAISWGPCPIGCHYSFRGGVRGNANLHQPTADAFANDIRLQGPGIQSSRGRALHGRDFAIRQVLDEKNSTVGSLCKLVIGSGHTFEPNDWGWDVRL